MQSHLDFFYFLGGTYTYLAVNRAEEMALRHGVTLRWRPFSVRTLMREQNNTPFENLSEILVRIGRDPAAVIERANGEVVRGQYVAETDEARNLGVFGSPTFVCGTEIFWGDDRLEEAVEWCRVG